ncbi:hypothetical protein [Microbulbifer halophilus]|uniref:hypothetical protein n=1 Tax=Microbulbifer halophilus TaxID=453963 RepID=UPI00361E1834
MAHNDASGSTQGNIYGLGVDDTSTGNHLHFILTWRQATKTEFTTGVHIHGLGDAAFNIGYLDFTDVFDTNYTTAHGTGNFIGKNCRGGNGGCPHGQSKHALGERFSRKQG